MASSTSRPEAFDAVDSWDRNAQYWDQHVGVDGNQYWTRLQKPCLQRFLGDHLKRDDCRALEFATGNGLCARWMAQRGARVLATDGAARMLERAKERCSHEPKIEFMKVDVTSDEEIEVLAKDGDRFDIILINMAIMDISTLDPLARALPKLLKNDGVFVATLLHPVFMTSIYSRTAEKKFNSETLDFDDTIGKNIFEYLHVKPYKGVAAVGQDHPQIYFHRPVHEILSVFFRHGLVLDGFEEPCFTAEDADPRRPLSTSNYTQLPPIMGFRMRTVGKW